MLEQHASSVLHRQVKWFEFVWKEEVFAEYFCKMGTVYDRKLENFVFGGLWFFEMDF